MRRLAAALIVAPLLLGPMTAVAAAEGDSQDCAAEAMCETEPTADATTETGVAPTGDADAPAVVQTDTTPAPSTSAWMRTLPPPTLIQAPFAAPETGTAAAESVQRTSPSPQQHLPPGPPSRWP
jgi:hypothetical protein